MGKCSRNFVRVVALLSAAQAMAWAAPEAPVAVSPGGPSQAQEILTRCPTFSWATVAGARGYELAVRPALSVAPGGKRASARPRSGSALPVLSIAVEGPASSWTPSAEQCLQAGVTYEWRVREVDDSGFGIGDWSEAKYFRVGGETPPSADERAAGRSAGIEGVAKGNTTGGIPAVLDTLAELQMQIQMNDDLLNRRLDALQARIDAVDMKVDTVGMTVDNVETKVQDVEDSHKPCTPKQWLEDKCAKQGHPLDMSATFCFDVGLGAELGAEYAVEPGVELEGGAAWTSGPDGEAKLKVEIPGVIPAGPVPIFLPDVKVAAKAAGNASLQICFSGLTFAVGDLGGNAPAGSAALASAQDIEQFTQKLVDAVQARAADIYDSTIGFMNDRNVDPGKIPDMFARLKDLRSLRSEGSDPLDAFKQGPIRDFLDTLPLDAEVKDLLDNPAQAIPSFDRSDPFALCDTLKSISIGGHGPGAVCDFAAEDMPDLAEVADNIRNFPDTLVDKMCDAIPGLSCGSNPVSCRLSCASQKTQCVSNCGFFQFQCKRQCEAQRQACVNNC